jgi:large subunit ribosomal protein L18
MSLLKKLKQRLNRRIFRVRSMQKSRGFKIRVSVFRSLNHIYAQLIDDSKHETLASLSTLTLKNANGSKKDVAKQVGIKLGKLAIDKNITDVYFDRGGYLYHGRVQALADGLREAGLKF